jgi:peptidoglycan/LPS O-acetylase OafA/YrhL
MPEASPGLAPTGACHARGFGHQPALDGLRAFAVLLVLYGHAPLLLGRGEFGPGHPAPGGLWHGSRGAWLGVDLFFVISGFLITSILLAQKGTERAFRRFWLRRALRIFPLAYLYLAMLAVLAWGTPFFQHLRAPTSFGWAVAYLTNAEVCVSGWPALPFAPLWSLAVEEHFYLVWPVVVLCCQRRTVLVVLLATIVVVPILRAALLPRLGPDGVYVATFCRADTLAFGALLAVLRAGPRSEQIRRSALCLLAPALAAIAAVLLLPIRAVDPTTPAAFHWLGYSAIAAAFAVACAAALAPVPSWLRWLQQRWLGAIGRISYGLYIWHVLTAEIVNRGAERLPFHLGFHGRVALWLVCLFAIATLSYLWFELPLLRRKDRIR